jgi:hypothetical protein
VRCYSLLLGARNTPLARRRFSRSDETLIRRITAVHFPEGYTMLESHGGWYDPTRRRFIGEESRQILVCAPSLAPVRRWAAALAQALKQRELLVVQLGPAFLLSPKSGSTR